METVKTQTVDLTERGKEAANDNDGSIKPALPIGVGAIALLAIGVAVLMIRRRPRQMFALKMRKR